jgi:serralysin
MLAMTTPTSTGAASLVSLVGLGFPINALVEGDKWGGSVGHGATVTYSFPWVSGNAVFAGYGGAAYSPLHEDTATYHYGLDATQRDAARAALAEWANVADLTFVESADTTTLVGDMRFGWTSATQSAGGSAAWGWAGYPTSFWPSGGDVWISTASSGLDDPDWSIGSFNFNALMHEIGHGLGLKHPFEDGAVLPAAYDNKQYTLMSYDAGPHAMFLEVVPTGNGGASASWYDIDPETPMVLDIAAIQYLYGANMAYRTGDDTYTFDTATPFLKTIWDAGGTDTISVSNFSRGCTIDLRPGSYSSIAIPSDTGDGYSWGSPLPTPTYDGTDNLGIAYGCTIENATGGSGNDVLIGNDAANRLEGGGGNDTIDGGAGTDSLAYSAPISGFKVTYANGTATVTGAGTDTAVNFEKIVFSDRSIDLGVSAAASHVSSASLTKVIELYTAFFNRVPDGEGMEYWLGRVAAGVSVSSIANSFYEAAVQYSSLTGYSASMSNANFVDVIYRNVLGRTSADAEGLAYWTTALASGAETRASLVDTILASAHTFKGNATYGWVADLLDNKALVGKVFAVDLGLSFNTPEQSISQGMAIAAAVTPTSTSAAIALIGVQPSDIHLA